MPTVGPIFREALLLWANVFPVSGLRCVSRGRRYGGPYSRPVRYGFRQGGFGRTGYEEIAKRCLIC